MEDMFTELISIYNQAVTGTINPVVGAAEILWWLIVHGGWIIMAYFVLLYAHYRFDDYIVGKFDSKRRWVLLAIDVPKDNIQSPRAVENIFATLAGAQSTPKPYYRYVKGQHADWFSFEIVAIEGYVQFIIRTVDTYRDLVEAAIYGQYPDAEITEVEDYTDGYPTAYPNDRYQIYGTEFYYVENEALPIRTYPSFEDPATREFKDPLQGLLEVMNKLGPGEQIWFQMLLEPSDSEWKKNSKSYIKSIMESKDSKPGPGIISMMAKELGLFYQSAQDQLSGGAGLVEGGSSSSSDASSASSLLLLPPQDRAKVEGAAEKMKKIGYMVKLRHIYIARKENWFPAHGREAFIGAIKQFNTEDLNALRPDTKHVGVHANYLFAEQRKDIKRTKLMSYYKARSMGSGRNPIIMNIEELATLWHFPVKTEFQPIRHMVQRTQTKSTPPPTTLPFASLIDESTVNQVPNIAGENKKGSGEAGPPPNLPIV